jgi:hypothetical protein
MNREEYLAFHEAVCKDLVETTKRKKTMTIVEKKGHQIHLPILENASKWGFVVLRQVFSPG